MVAVTPQLRWGFFHQHHAVGQLPPVSIHQPMLPPAISKFGPLQAARAHGECLVFKACLPHLVPALVTTKISIPHMPCISGHRILQGPLTTCPARLSSSRAMISARLTLRQLPEHFQASSKLVFCRGHFDSNRLELPIRKVILDPGPVALCDHGRSACQACHAEISTTTPNGLWHHTPFAAPALFAFSRRVSRC